MYFSLIPVQQTGKIKFKTGTLANPRIKEEPWSMQMAGMPKVASIYRTLEGDKIIRDQNKLSWRLTLNHSCRENGKVKKKQAYIHTIHYWDVVDDWLLWYRMKDDKESEIQTGVCTSGDGEWFDKQVLKVFPDADLKDVWELFQDKVKDFEQSIIKEFKASDEFKWWKLNRTLHERIVTLKKQDKAKEEQQRQQNNQQKFRQQYQGSSSYQQEGIPVFPSARIEISSKEAELIYKCYKVMATQVHPDKGGSLEDMQILNNLKDRIRKSK